MDRYRVLTFHEGELGSDAGYSSREEAERAFGEAVEAARRMVSAEDADGRVELWGEDVLLMVYDTSDRP